jgi:hypothetical protein
MLRTALFWFITQSILVISYRIIGPPMGPPIQMDSSPLKMGAVGCLETSVRNCHYSLRNNPEARSSDHLRVRGLELRLYLCFLQTVTQPFDSGSAGKAFCHSKCHCILRTTAVNWFWRTVSATVLCIS